MKIKLNQINRIIFVAFAFSLTCWVESINQNIAYACHAHGGNSRDLIGCSFPKPNQRPVSPASNSFTRIIVNFTSIGSGIDRDSEQKLLDFVQSDYPQIKFSQQRWGREGEITYTFVVESLSPQARRNFLSRIKQIVEQGKFINLTIGDEKSDRSDQQANTSSEKSPNLSTLQADLQRVLAGKTWQREKTKQSPYRPFLWFYSGSNHNRLSIQSREFGSEDKPYPWTFPFVDFELKEREGKRYIVPTKGNIQESGISELPYRLEKNRLIIEAGKITVKYAGGQEEIDLQGEYKPEFR